MGVAASQAAARRGPGLLGSGAEGVGAAHPRPPGDKARDFSRYEWVVNLMYPVTTHPELGLVRTKQRVSKTKAVSELADMEARWWGRRPDERGIWRSLHRVEAYYERLQAQLELARTNVAARARRRSR